MSNDSRIRRNQERWTARSKGRFPPAEHVHHDYQAKLVEEIAVSTSPFTPPIGEYYVLFINTDDSDIIINLSEGAAGTSYRMIDVGGNGNKVTINGGGSENIFGESSQYLYDDEVLDIVYNKTHGWH